MDHRDTKDIYITGIVNREETELLYYVIRYCTPIDIGSYRYFIQKFEVGQGFMKTFNETTIKVAKVWIGELQTDGTRIY